MADSTETNAANLEPGAGNYVVGEMRVQTMEGCECLLLRSMSSMTQLRKTVDYLVQALEQTAEASGVTVTGPLALFYYGMSPEYPTDLFYLAAGFPVQPGAKAEGDALLRTLNPFPCAALLYWGTLEHLPEARQRLKEAMQAAGLTSSRESREWYLYFESDDSPNNVVLLQEGIEKK